MRSIVFYRIIEQGQWNTLYWSWSLSLCFEIKEQSICWYKVKRIDEPISMVNSLISDAHILIIWIQLNYVSRIEGVKLFNLFKFFCFSMLKEKGSEIFHVNKPLIRVWHSSIKWISILIFSFNTRNCSYTLIFWRTANIKVHQYQFGDLSTILILLLSLVFSLSLSSFDPFFLHIVVHQELLNSCSSKFYSSGVGGWWQS